MSSGGFKIDANPLKHSRRRLIARRKQQAILTFVGLIVCLGQMMSFQFVAPLSGYDEIGHIDYAVKLSTGSVPKWGETLDQRTLQIADCVGSASRPSVSCEDRIRDPSAQFASGYSYEAQQPPLGYVVPALVYHFAESASLSPATVIALLRASSVLLMAAFVGLFAYLLSRFRCSTYSALAALLLVCTSPHLVSSWSYVTNDGIVPIAAAISSVLGWFALKRNGGPTHRQLWLVACSILVGLLIGLSKITLLAVPITLLIFGILQYLRCRQLRYLNLIRMQLFQIVVAILSSLTYTFWVKGTSPQTIESVMSRVLETTNTNQLSVETLANSISGVVGIFGIHDPNSPFDARIMTSPLGLVSMFAFGIFFVSLAANILPVSPWAHMSTGHSLAIAILISGGTAAIVWPLYSFFAFNSDFELPTRYLIALVPLVGLACIPVFQASRTLAISFIAIAVCTAVIFPSSWNVIETNYSAAISALRELIS